MTPTNQTTRTGAAGTIFVGGALVIATLALYRARTGVQLDFSEAEIAAFTTLANLLALGVAPILSAARGALLRLLGAGLVVALALPLSGCALSRSTLDVVDPAGKPVSASHARLSVLRNGPFENRLSWGALALEQRGCDQGVSGNATLGAVAVGALAAGPVGAAAGGAAAAAAEWARSRAPEVSHQAGGCPAFSRGVPAIPAPVGGP